MTRKRITILVDEPVHRRLAMVGYVTGRSMQQVCEDGLAAYVETSLGDEAVRSALESSIEEQAAALRGTERRADGASGVDRYP